MAAGVTDRVWDMNDVAALIAAQEAPIAKRAYAWEQDRPDGKKRYAGVLHLGGITGPVESVRAAIVAEARAGK